MTIGNRVSSIMRPLLTASVLVVMLLVPLANGSYAQGLESGTHYDPITPPVPHSGNKGTVIEVFNFKCGHCYKLHPHMDRWTQANKGKYNIKSLPIFWGNQTDMPIRAYYAAEFLGKGPEMKDGIFKAQFENSTNIESVDELGFLAEEVGLDPEKFKSYLTSFGVGAKVAQAKSQQRSFAVHSTPTLVVNGRYRVSFGSHAHGDPEKLFQIVESLAKQ